MSTTIDFQRLYHCSDEIEYDFVHNICTNIDISKHQEQLSDKELELSNYMERLFLDIFNIDTLEDTEKIGALKILMRILEIYGTYIRKYKDGIGLELIGYEDLLPLLKVKEITSWAQLGSVPIKIETTIKNTKKFQTLGYFLIRDIEQYKKDEIFEILQSVYKEDSEQSHSSLSFGGAEFATDNKNLSETDKMEIKLAISDVTKNIINQLRSELPDMVKQEVNEKVVTELPKALSKTLTKLGN